MWVISQRNPDWQIIFHITITTLFHNVTRDILKLEQCFKKAAEERKEATVRFFFFLSFLWTAWHWAGSIVPAGSRMWSLWNIPDGGSLTSSASQHLARVTQGRVERTLLQPRLEGRGEVLGVDVFHQRDRRHVGRHKFTQKAPARVQ